MYLGLSSSAPIWPPPGAALSVDCAGVARCVRVRPGLLVAAGGCRAGATGDVGLVERDDDEHVTVLVRGRVEDEGHPRPQEPVRCRQAARLAACAVRPGTGPVVAVVAQVGRDEPEARRGFLAAEVLRQVAGGRRGPVGAQGPEGDHVGVALGRVVDHRVEPHERVVPSGVLVGRRRHLGRVGGPDGSGARSPCHRVGSGAPPSREGVLPMSCS